LLEARMKITPYNQHTRLLSFRALVSLRCQVYSASGEEPTLLSNQLHSKSSFWVLAGVNERYRLISATTLSIWSAQPRVLPTDRNALVVAPVTNVRATAVAGLD